jgi:hypothetical protein
MESLAKISYRFEQACSFIDNKMTYALSIYLTNPVIAESLISFCVVKLHDQWNARCRELITKSALGNYRTLSGSVLPRTAKTNPLQQLRNVWSSKKAMDASWEPDWHVPNVSVRAADLLKIRNYDTVANAISALTLVDDLRWTRNVVVHELPRTYYKFRTIQSTKFNPPIFCAPAYVVQRIPGTTNLIIDSWMNELKLALRAAIK